jgi:alanine racemase
VPRHATNLGPVAVGGRRFTVSGRVCMDQFVVDVGDLPVRPGDAVTLFGPGRDGEPLARDWAEAIGTIDYEIVTRVGARVPRVYVGDGAVAPDAR